MGEDKKEGYYWVKFSIKGNWVIAFLFNSGSWFYNGTYTDGAPIIIHEEKIKEPNYTYEKKINND